MNPKMLLAMLIFYSSCFTFAGEVSAPTPKPTPPPNRAVSVYISEDFMNEQIAAHQKSEMVKEVKVQLDPENDQILLHGVIHVPVEEMRAVNLDPKLGAFRFQLAIRLSTTQQGHLVLEFPLNETYFYPADSKNPKQDRVIVPVQMLSLVLASARGYLAALSGDFGGFDRQTAKLEALKKSLDRSIAIEKNADARDELKNQREALKLQLAAVPVERKQLQALSKELSTMLGFTGEKELNLNDDLAARQNALILKVKLSQLVPFLKGVELGGVRILHDKKDGNGQNYFVIDVNADLAIASPSVARKPADRVGMKVAPALILRLNQALLESEAIVSEEQKDMGSKLKNFDLQLKDDGLHVSGKWKTFFFFSLPFDTVVDFVTTAPDVFEIRVRKLDLAGMDVEFLSKFVLESIKKRLDKSMKGICKFKYVGEEADHSRALEVTVDSKALVPAFPDLHLVDVDIRDREFLLKIGK